MTSWVPPARAAVICASWVGQSKVSKITSYVVLRRKDRAPWIRRLDGPVRDRDLGVVRLPPPRPLVKLRFLDADGKPVPGAAMAFSGTPHRKSPEVLFGQFGPTVADARGVLETRNLRIGKRYAVSVYDRRRGTQHPAEFVAAADVEVRLD